MCIQIVWLHQLLFLVRCTVSSNSSQKASVDENPWILAVVLRSTAKTIQLRQGKPLGTPCLASSTSFERSCFSYQTQGSPFKRLSNTSLFKGEGGTFFRPLSYFQIKHVHAGITNSCFFRSCFVRLQSLSAA